MIWVRIECDGCGEPLAEAPAAAWFLVHRAEDALDKEAKTRRWAKDASGGWSCPRCQRIEREHGGYRVPSLVPRAEGR